MPADKGGSRALLRGLRAVMAGPGDGQQRLDKVVRLVASNMVAEVCSIYLKRDERTLELCATEGLKQESVHTARLRIGQGLVGRIAERAEPFATDDAQSAPGFRYLPETGEEIYHSFVGVPVQRLGEVMGVLVVQNETRRHYTEEEVEALEIVAMVISEMTEAGAFRGSDGIAAGPQRRSGPVVINGMSACDGLAEGVVHLHEPRLVVFDPIADNVETERARLAEAMEALRDDVDKLVEGNGLGATGEHREVFETYRMFAYDKGWRRRLDEAIDSGLAAEVAVEKVQSETRARMERVADPYLRERLHDLDDLANRLLRYMVVAEDPAAATALPQNAVLVARNIGPGELMDHAGRIVALVLEEGSLSSHATIVARALAIPTVVQAERITRDANPGDPIVVDGNMGRVDVRPEGGILDAFREKVALAEQAKEVYRTLRDKPATTLCGATVKLKMNAGVLADLPSINASGAEGVGLYRTELQFLLRKTMPGRDAQASLYSRVLDAAKGRDVTFRTLDIGSDKILPYLKREEEPNPALGWRAIRVGLDRPRLFRMQIQALVRGANGRPFDLMFPMVAEAAEFRAARALVEREVARMAALGHPAPARLRVGFMLETPSLAYASDRLFQEADFVSVGGNDLMQFFFAADRQNERVRMRYDVLNFSFLRLLEQIARRCADAGTTLSYCGEAAGRPLEAVVLVSRGFRELSMRPASIGPVKRALMSVDLDEVRQVMAQAESADATSARPALRDWATARSLPF